VSYPAKRPINHHVTDRRDEAVADPDTAERSTTPQPLTPSLDSSTSSDKSSWPVGHPRRGESGRRAGARNRSR
jgi:hypothetical protein